MPFFVKPHIQERIVKKDTFIFFLLVSMLFVAVGHLFYTIFYYDNSFVHPDFYRYILPESLRHGLRIQWGDLIDSLQLRSPGEFRPRFLAYFIQALDQKIRLYLYDYIFIPPALAPIAWFIQLTVGPYYLFKAILNITSKYQAAIVSVLIYITSIGFLSGFTMGLLQGKSLANVAFILAFYLMSEIDIKAKPKQLLYETDKLKKYGLLLMIFLGLFLDELPLFVFILIPLSFPHRFFTKEIKDVKRIVRNGLFFCLPAFMFLIVVLLLIPYLTNKYFGFEFDYLGNTLAIGENTRGAHSMLQGPYATFNLSLIWDNFLTLFGLSIAPWQASPLIIGQYGDYYTGQENNITKIVILFCFFLSIGLLVLREKKIKQYFVGFLFAFALFFCFLSLLLVRHIPVATGYYYGTSFAVLFSILIGFYYSMIYSSGKWVRQLGSVAVLIIVMIQVDNFIPINRGWIKTHNEDLTRPSFQERISLTTPQLVTKKELHSIWAMWKQKKLEEYLRTTSISTGAVYLVFELEMLDKVRKDGFVEPHKWN